MIATTLSDLFDTRLNSFVTGIEKDEYEKSLYLTAAQDAYYDAILEQFDVTNTISEKAERLLAHIEVTTFTSEVFGGLVASFTPMKARKIFREKVLFKNDSTTLPLYRGKEVRVKEDRLSEIQDSLDNPFRLPSLDFVNRVIEGTPDFSKVTLYIPKNTQLEKYTATIGREPAPIILEDLPSPLVIRDSNIQTVNFEFKDKDLEKILEIAVSLVLKDLGYADPTHTVVDEKQKANTDSSRK